MATRRGNRLCVAMLAAVCVFALASCSDDRSDLSTAAGAADGSGTTTTAAVRRAATTVAPDTTVTTVAPGTTAPVTRLPTTTAAPVTAPDGRLAPPTEFTLELVGTTTERCPVGQAECWNIRASWRGSPELLYSITPGSIPIGSPATYLPMGPAPYGTEGDRLVAYFGMIAGQHDCPDIRSARSTPAPQGGYYIETSEPASACIDTPATEPAG